MTITKQKSIHGLDVFTSTDAMLVARRGFVAGGNDKPAIVLPGSPDITAIFEDFYGSPDNQNDDTGKAVTSSPFNARYGDTGHKSRYRVGTNNGVFALFQTPSATAALAPGSGVSLQGGANFDPDQGPGDYPNWLRLACRLRLENVTRTAKRIHVFAGFTDIQTYEYPAYDTGAGVISAATDYMGFMFSPGGDTGWSGVAGKGTAGDSGDQVVALDTGVAANIYDTLELEYRRDAGDTGGVVTFWVNGEPKGRIVSPVRSSGASLAPCVFAFQQDTGGEYVDIDWINVAALRDTGS